MIALQTRRQVLLLESDLNRLRFRAELHNLRESISFTNLLRWQFGSWTSVLVPVAGVILALVMKRSSVAGGVLRKVVGGAPALMRLWRAISKLLSEFR